MNNFKFELGQSSRLTIGDLKQGDFFVYAVVPLDVGNMLQPCPGNGQPIVCIVVDFAPDGYSDHLTGYKGREYKGEFKVGTVPLNGPNTGHVQRSKSTTPVIKVCIDSTIRRDE